MIKPYLHACVSSRFSCTSRSNFETEIYSQDYFFNKQFALVCVLPFFLLTIGRRLPNSLFYDCFRPFFNFLVGLSILAHFFGLLFFLLGKRRISPVNDYPFRTSPLTYPCHMSITASIVVFSSDSICIDSHEFIFQTCASQLLLIPMLSHCLL